MPSYELKKDLIIDLKSVLCGNIKLSRRCHLKNRKSYS